MEKMKKTSMGGVTKSPYQTPETSEIKVSMEVNIMSYGDPNAAGGTLPEYSGDPYSI